MGNIVVAKTIPIKNVISISGVNHPQIGHNATQQLKKIKSISALAPVANGVLLI